MIETGNFGINNVVDNQNIAEKFGGMGALRGNEGKIDGMDVKIDDPLSAIEDSAEELTFAKDNSKKMKLADRKQKSSDMDLYKKMAVFLQIANLMHNADYEARKRITDRAVEYHGNIKKLLSDMAKLGGNKVHDFVALQNAADNSPNPEIRDFLKQAAQQLLSENSSEILSVLNTVEEAQHSDLGEACELSERYSELSNTCKSPDEMLRYIGEKFGDDRIEDGVDFMLKALGADLSSPVASQETALLENIGTNLSMVRTLNSAKSIVTGFTDRLQKAHGIVQQVSISKIISGLINISKQKFVSPSAIRSLYDGIPNQRPDVEVLMAQDMLSVCRNLSDEMFDNDESRVRLITVAENLVNQLVEQEDVWLENGGGQ